MKRDAFSLPPGVHGPQAEYWHRLALDRGPVEACSVLEEAAASLERQSRAALSAVRREALTAAASGLRADASALVERFA